MLKYSIACFMLIFLFNACKSDLSLDQSSDAKIDYKKDIIYLASDELQGREIGTEGETLAAEYISAKFKSIGLKAAGDNGTYFQHFSVKQKSNPHAEQAAP
ncbi:MAG: peptidase M28, partial [Bacteroidota bacterium]